jgi:site-specific DNA-methyltransferase (adenine-specific)
MKPYYQDSAVTIYHGDCRDVLGSLADASVDLVLTDPPYSSATHEGARTQAMVFHEAEERIDFSSISEEELVASLTDVGRVARRWVVATMDWRHIGRLADCPPPGLRFVRFGVWVKPNGAPQFTGDRPGPGWEGVAFLHREGAPLEWHGGGRSSVWIHNKVNSDHPTGKPLPLIGEWVSLFSNPGDLVLDPWMGAGTTLRAAKDRGRRAIGIEIEERYCEVAARRLSQEVLDLGAA